MNPPVFRWSLPFEFSFCGGKTRFTHAIAANKRANSHNFKIKKLNLLIITFLAVYLMNRGKSSYMNESSMRVKNTFRWIIAKLVPLFFKCSCAFFSYVLPDWQVPVIDTCKNNVSKFVWKPLNHLRRYGNENFSARHLSLICITSILTTIYS